MLDRQFWLSQDATARSRSVSSSDFEGGKIRGLRVGVVGTLNFKRRWRYTVFVTTNTFDKGFDVEDRRTNSQLFDYRLDIPLPADLTLSVGKQKEPISMERLMGLTFLPMQERSAAIDACSRRATTVSFSQRRRRGLIHLGGRGVQQLDRLGRVLQ